MIIQKIFIDMDGVLADFNKGLIELLNIQPMPQENQPVEWQEKMWNKISKYSRFYLDLQPISGAVESFKNLYTIFGDKIEILTGIPKPTRNVPFASQDKTEWVKRYLSSDVKVNTVLRAEKLNFSKGREYILIDDYSKNIKECTNTGGTGILFDNWQNVMSEINSLCFPG